MWDYEKAVSHATRIMKKRFLMLLAAWDCWKAVSRACVWDYEKAVFGWVWDYEKAVSLATRIMKKRFFMLLRWEWANGGEKRFLLLLGWVHSKNCGVKITTPVLMEDYIMHLHRC